MLIGPDADSISVPIFESIPIASRLDTFWPSCSHTPPSYEKGGAGEERGLGKRKNGDHHPKDKGCVSHEKKRERMPDRQK